MRRATRDTGAVPAASSSPLLRWGGSGAVLAGVLFLAWGYLDRPGVQGAIRVVVDVLSFAVPALFLAGLIGLYAYRQGRGRRLRNTGILLGFVGSALGAADGLTNAASWHVRAAVSGWPGVHLSSGWLPTLLAGLTLAGIAAVGTRTPRGLDALPLAMGVFGWVYYFTDSGAVLEARAVHVGSGLLFGLGWVMLGLALRARGTRRAKEPPPPGQP